MISYLNQKTISIVLKFNHVQSTSPRNHYTASFILPLHSHEHSISFHLLILEEGPWIRGYTLVDFIMVLFNHSHIGLCSNMVRLSENYVCLIKTLVKATGDFCSPDPLKMWIWAVSRIWCVLIHCQVHKDTDTRVIW